MLSRQQQLLCPRRGSWLQLLSPRRGTRPRLLRSAFRGWGRQERSRGVGAPRRGRVSGGSAAAPAEGALRTALRSPHPAGTRPRPRPAAGPINLPRPGRRVIGEEKGCRGRPPSLPATPPSGSGSGRRPVGTAPTVTRGSSPRRYRCRLPPMVPGAAPRSRSVRPILAGPRSAPVGGDGTGQARLEGAALLKPTTSSGGFRWGGRAHVGAFPSFPPPPSPAPAEGAGPDGAARPWAHSRRRGENERGGSRQGFSEYFFY